MKNSNDFLLLRQPIREELKLENNLYKAFITRFPVERVVPPHHHPVIEIVVAEGVKGETYADGKKYVAGKGSVHIIRPESIHSFKLSPDGGGVVYVLQIDTDECGRLISGFSKSGIAEFYESLRGLPVECETAAGEVAECIKKLSQITDTDHPQDKKPVFQSAMSDVERIYRILQLITMGRGPAAREKKQDAKIRRVIDVIESLASTPTSLEEIAKKSALSKFHLCRIFKQATGMTVQTYLNELRISRACRMLADEGKNVTEACFDCGFENVSYFIQVFKTRMGIPPKQWAIGEKKKHERILI